MELRGCMQVNGNLHIRGSSKNNNRKSTFIHLNDHRRHMGSIPRREIALNSAYSSIYKVLAIFQLAEYKYPLCSLPWNEAAKAGKDLIAQLWRQHHQCSSKAYRARSSPAPHSMYRQGQLLGWGFGTPQPAEISSALTEMHGDRKKIQFVNMFSINYLVYRDRCALDPLPSNDSSSLKGLKTKALLEHDAAKSVFWPFPDDLDGWARLTCIPLPGLWLQWQIYRVEWRGALFEI